jgi:hypothetical protein
VIGVFLHLVDEKEEEKSNIKNWQKLNQPFFRFRTFSLFLSLCQLEMIEDENHIFWRKKKSKLFLPRQRPFGQGYHSTNVAAD